MSGPPTLSHYRVGTPLPVGFPHQAVRLEATGWAPGNRLRLEGFLKTYRGRLELVVSYGVWTGDGDSPQ